MLLEWLSGQNAYRRKLLQCDADVAMLCRSSSRSTDRTPLKVNDLTSGRSL